MVETLGESFPMCQAETYVALQWPDERLKRAGLYSFRAKHALRDMQQQVERRGPITAEVWGVEPSRWQVARRVAVIIKDAIGWKADHFIPDDPVDILLWGGWYDMGEVDAMMRIERQFAVDILKELSEAIFKGQMTFGQLVDYLIEHAGCLATWPRHGETSLEAGPHPSVTAFRDLTGFVERHCHAPATRIRPSTDLRAALPRSDWPQCERFLNARFGVRGLIRRRFLGVASPGWTWLALCVLGVIGTARVIGWQLIGSLLAGLCGAILFGIVVGRLSRPTWRHRRTTARQVVKWILWRRRAAGRVY